MPFLWPAREKPKAYVVTTAKSAGDAADHNTQLDSSV